MTLDSIGSRHRFSSGRRHVVPSTEDNRQRQHGTGTGIHGTGVLRSRGIEDGFRQQSFRRWSPGSRRCVAHAHTCGQNCADMLPADAALATARVIASKSPIAVLGTKHLMNYSRDHTTAEGARFRTLRLAMENADLACRCRSGLTYTALWNSAMLQSADLKEAIGAFLQKRKPRFSKL